MQADKAHYIPVFSQPLPAQSPNMCCSPAGVEKHRSYACDELDGTAVPTHPNCHRRRRQRIFSGVLIGASAFFLFLLVLYAMHVCLGGKNTGEGGVFEAIGGLLKRATTSSTSDSGPFIKNKLYLIIIFVGLVVVLILGLMLSAWCCRGSFQNPLCCPCYLCACCGGLACLECIGCGLCAAGADQF